MILSMARRHVHDVFVVFIVCIFSSVCAGDPDDITTIYRFNELDSSFRPQDNIEKLDRWEISPDFLWTYNTMVDVPFPGEGNVSWSLKPASITEILPINTEETFAVSSNITSFNVYLMSNKDPQLGNIIVLRLTESLDSIEVLTCKYGKEGEPVLLPGIGSRKCLQEMKKVKITFTTHVKTVTLYFEPNKGVLGSHSGFLLTLPEYFHAMKYICIGTGEYPGNFTFRKPAHVLALAESSGYMSHSLPVYQNLLCFNLFYYMDQKSGGEISFYHKMENNTLLGKLFSQQQMGSWQIHRLIITLEEVQNGYLEIHAKKNSNAPLLIHSLQNCDGTGTWDSTTFTKPGNVDIHARTNALGRPFHLHNGSIIDPNVEIDVPSCPNHDQNCEWVLNNWSHIVDYTSEMETAPLPLWTEKTYRLNSDESVLSEIYPFSRYLSLPFSVEIIADYDKHLRMYISESTHVNNGFMALIKITENSLDVFEKHPGWGNYERIWIPGANDESARTVCSDNSPFYLTGGKNYRMSFEIVGNQAQVVVEGQANGKLECTGELTYMNEYTTYYLSSATRNMKATLFIDGRVNYMLSPDKDGGAVTSPLILPSTDELCISLLYYKTGGTLTLDAELLNGSRVLLEELSNTDDWKYKRILSKIGHQPLRLVLHGSKDESGKLLVQRIAGCHPEEDIAKLGQEQNLQVIKPNSLRNAEQTLVTNSCKNGGLLHKEGHCICPPGFIGIHCEQACGSDRFGGDCNGRCSHSSRKCKGMLLCKPYWGCSCAPGYKGLFCSEGCEDGKYGADCQQTCGHCASWGCNGFTGMCSEGCQDGFHPPMCQEKCSYFGTTPVVQRTANKLSILLSEPILGNGSALYYQIQYKEEIYSPWLTIYSAPMKDILPSGTINIAEPSAEESYFIRAVIINEDACSYQEETVPFVEVKATCKIPDLKMYHLVTTDLGEDNFTIIWKPPTNNGDWCEISHYEVFLKQGWDWFLYDTTKSSSLHITEQSPEETYQVKVRAVTTLGDITDFTESVKVKTNMLSVAEIQNFKVTASDSTQLLLKWEYPYHAKYFLITYECAKLLGCPHESCDHSKGHYQSQDTSATLRDLLPLAQYKVKIAAFSDTYGPSSVLQALTLPAGSEAPPTMVEEAIKDRTNTSFTVQWGPPSSCSKLNGFQQGYWYRFRPAGGKTTLLDGSTLQSSASFNDLIPHTQYEVDVFVVTNGGWDEKYPLRISVSTRATTPERVANLTVYRRSRREIGLRWAPPAQTYGELQSFTISYIETTLPTKPSSKVIHPTSCSAWPDLYCFTVKKLRPNVEYSLSVQARNVEVPEDGDASSVLAKTQEGSPTAPSYIQMVTKDSTSLTMKWGIPWLLNGILRSFLVSVEEVDSFNASDCCEYFPTREIPVNAEESFYQIEVPGLRPASTYTISVSAKTMGFGPAINLTAHTKPPVPSIPLQPRVMSEDSDDFKVQLTPVTESLGLVRGYLLLLVPEQQDETLPEATIWDDVLDQNIKTAINRSFYIVGEYSQDQLTGDGMIHFLDQEQHQPIGILSEHSQFSLISGEPYKVILVAVLEYEGAYSFSFKESDTFIAPISFSSRG